ncbi:SDR family NAD(P)-dependent oxidoreductase [Pseudomonas sp. GB2N2]
MNIDALAARFGLPGKLALITDSGGLASLEVSAALAQAGAHVLIADRDPEALEALVHSIRGAGGIADALPCDIESESSVVALFGQIEQRFGRLDILVNCAGLNANQPFTAATLEQFDAVNSLNLRATFLLLREGVRLMRKAGQGGRIVNITTMGAMHPVLHGNQAYSATRAAVGMLTRCTALDNVCEGILANVVLPGAFVGKTRFHESTLQTLQSGGTLAGPGTDPGRLPMGYGDPQDIASAVLYLVGPAGGYITGQSLVLDGGFLLS